VWLLFILVWRGIACNKCLHRLDQPTCEETNCAIEEYTKRTFCDDIWLALKVLLLCLLARDNVFDQVPDERYENSDNGEIVSVKGILVACLLELDSFERL